MLAVIPSTAPNLFLAGIATTISTMNVTSARTHDTSARRIVMIPDFWRAKRRDDSEPRYEGGRRRERTQETVVIAAVDREA